MILKSEAVRQAARHEYLSRWRRVFALLPRQVSKTEVAWLCWVERRGIPTWVPPHDGMDDCMGNPTGHNGYYAWDWEYRRPG